MATKWILHCESSSGEEGSLEIVDAFLPIPGSDTWRGIEGPDVWGDPAEGTVAHWNTGSTILHVGMAAGHVLDGFTKTTKVNDSGAGSKVPVGGTFPDGAFTWTCTKRS